MHLVDTDVLIDIQRGHVPAVAWFAGLAELPGVPGFVVMFFRDKSHGCSVKKIAVSLLSVAWGGPRDFVFLHLASNPLVLL
jgi:hypothetical protein